ncbi:MAG: cytochrome P450, partial [Acidimicrobiia bacterium]
MSVETRPRGPVEVFLPQTYADAVPYGLFAELRKATPVCWIDEPAVGPWPAGPGFWAVFTHSEVKRVLRAPEVFSSRLGCTQIRDPETATDLEFGQAMMVNQDAPAHSRLRKIMAAAETLSPRGRAALDARPATMTLPDGRPLSPRSRAGLADMFAYANALAAERPSGIVGRMLDGGLTGPEFETMFFLFAVAGNETLRNGIPGGLACLL